MRRKEIPSTCLKCGALIALRTSRNGVWGKFDLNDDLRPTNTPHACNEASSKPERKIPRGTILIRK